MNFHRFRGKCATIIFTATTVAIPIASIAAPSLEVLGNIAYSGVYDEPVELSNGLYEGNPFVPDGAARPRVELLEELFVIDDIDGDGAEDAWVLLSESSGGTGNYLFLAAVTQADGSARNIGTLNIGDRVDLMSLDAANGNATLEYVTAGPDEPACCPTLMVSGVYGLKEGRLAELSRENRGNMSLQQLAGVPWRLTQFSRNVPVPDGADITAEFEGDRISGFAGCNNYFATVKAPTPYELNIGLVGATRKACPPSQMDAESRFLTALENSFQFSFMLGKLAMGYRTGEGYSTLIFERAGSD